MRIKVPNVAYNRSTNGFVILSERSESKDLLRSPSSTVKSPERSFDCALRAPLRMTYGSVIPASAVFQRLIRMESSLSIETASLDRVAESVIFGKKNHRFPSHYDSLMKVAYRKRLSTFKRESV